MRQDILLDDENDLAVADGDFVIGPSAEQEAVLLLKSHKGAWRESPTVGMGIDYYLKKRVGQSPLITSRPQFIRDAKLTLEADGFRDPEITVTNDLTDFKITVDP